MGEVVSIHCLPLDEEFFNTEFNALLSEQISRQVTDVVRLMFVEFIDNVPGAGTWDNFRVTFKVEVSDGIWPEPVVGMVSTVITNNACEASREMSYINDVDWYWDVRPWADLNEDCVTNLSDFAELALQWLDSSDMLQEPKRK